MKKILCALLCILLVLNNSYVFAKNKQNDFVKNILKLSDGDKITFGTWINYSKYGKDRVEEPITWKVYKTGTSMKDSKSFNRYTLISDTVVKDDIPFAKVKNGMTESGSWNYAESNVRDWLVNTFYEKAFSSVEKEYMENIFSKKSGINYYVMDSNLNQERMKEAEELAEDKVCIPSFNHLTYLGCKIDADEKDKNHIYYDFGTNDGQWYIKRVGPTSLTTTGNYSYWVLNRGYTNYKDFKGNAVNHPRVFVNHQGLIAGLTDETYKYITNYSQDYAKFISPEYDKHGIRAVISVLIPTEE